MINIIVAIAGIVIGAVQYADSSKKANKLSNQGLAISSLSYADQRILNEKILKANTQTQRQAILANAVSNIYGQQALQKEKNRQTMAILILTGSTGLIMAAYLYKKV